jgi:hypothetical protein
MAIEERTGNGSIRSRAYPVVVSPGAGNHFHRQPGDQWWVVQEGEVSYTVAGQPPHLGKAGKFVYLARHDSPQPKPLEGSRALDTAQYDRQGQPQTEQVPPRRSRYLSEHGSLTSPSSNRRTATMLRFSQRGLAKDLSRPRCSENNYG